MSEETPPTWPTMPGGIPARQPVTDPLAPAHRSTLDPAPMPSERGGLTAAGAAAPDDEDAPTANLSRRTVDLPVSTGNEKAVCPSCGSDVATFESFCEACGGELTPSTAPPPRGGDDLASTVETTRPTKLTEPQTPVSDERAIPRECADCQGLVGPDRYCTQCGARAVSERDHFDRQPSDWVAGVSDVGLRHEHNEDAMALWSEAAPASSAILVVCDGITTSHRSDIASMAAATAACDILVESLAHGKSSVDEALTASATAAQEAVIDVSDPNVPNPGSCTFAVAVVHEGAVYHGGIGDARVYWISDHPGSSRQLTVDDSMAQVRMDMGMSREEAENSIAAHAVTRWVGRDAVDLSPRPSRIELPGPGWVLACSDGLWNYASEAESLADIVRHAASETSSPVDLCQQLVSWACSQGGRDNITAAVARIEKGAV